MRKTIIALMLMIATISVYSGVNQTMIGEFSRADLSGWKQKKFAGETQYQIVTEQSQQFLRATSEATASALYKKVKVDLNETPCLNWSWRVDQPLAAVNEQAKLGDDYAARVYVIVRQGLTPWKTKALNYVWSSDAQPPMSWPNAFTSKAIMIPLRSKQDEKSWQHEKVNIRKDFKKYFKLDIERIDGVAIMTDTDNSQLQATASYGDIFFTAE